MPPISRPPRRLFRVLATALAVALAGSPVPAYGAEPGATLQTVPAAADRSYAVTLLTGDVVGLHIAADGRQGAWLQEPASEAVAEPRIYERDGQVHVIPAEAAPYLASGALDERLFDITYLAGHGYDDASRTDLPLLLSEPDEPAPGVRVVRELESIDAVSVTADKSRIREVWESVRGPRPAALDAADARLAGAETVWLNGRVEATLADSVGQVGAPAAWEAGYDGEGVTVAVLDTGHDPDHPDLAGRVAGARNFTEDPDPPGETAVDGHGHGTHVAATIAGSGDASDGARRGVAPGADLLVGKVLDGSGAGALDWVIAGMEWAVEQGAQVVNVSLGEAWSSDGTDPMSQAVDRLTESSGALFVVAAGNSGPREQSVGAPGAASHALTVGATTKDDRPTDFSSRGPRFGDLAIKPEIVAPGADIVAARAAGTSLGNLLDEDYTSLNGTSMATPHVAGAAAILAQQHPGWRADQLKARLVSTAEPLPDQPVTFQGAGRLDVAAAVATPVTVSDGALSIGRVADDARPLTRTLTYRNTSDRPAVLWLSTEVTGTGARADQRPALWLWPPVLVVPAGGQANAELRLSPALTRPGGYAGNVVARDLRNPSAEVHTAVAFTVEGPLRTVAVTGVDPDGAPSAGSVELWSAETGEVYYGFMFDGAATLEVPDGLYTVVTTLETRDDNFRTTSLTIAGEPELTVRRDTTLRYDARDAEPVRVTTSREADLDRFRVNWYRRVGDRSFASIAGTGLTGTALYTLPSRRATTGTFEVSTVWQLAQPRLTATVPGPDGFRIEPSPWFAPWADPYAGEESVPVVDAGAGTPEEFAAVDVEGKVALVTRREGWGELAAQAEAAAQAGALMLLAHNDRPGGWHEGLGATGLPVYLIEQAAGERLRDLLAADPDLALDLFGIPDATYSYHLVFPEPQIPAGRTYRADDHPTATVVSDFRESSDRMGRREWWIPYVGSSPFASGFSLPRNGPVVRTEYISTDGVRWNRFGQPHGEFLNVYWTWSGIRQYQPGQTYREQWWGPLTRPGVPPLSGLEQVGVPVTRFRDAIRIIMRHYLYDNGRASGTIYEHPVLGDTSELVLRRGGEVLGKSSWPEVQFTVPPDEAEYELELRVANGPGNFSDISVRTESTWRFRSGRPEQPSSVLPLVQVDYHLDAGSYNEVPAGVPYPLLIDPGYQPGATGPAGFTVSVEVSYDGGGSWATAPVTPADAGMLQATIPAAPAETGFADVRVVATDAAGNRLTQQIDQAWRIGTP